MLVAVVVAGSVAAAVLFWPAPQQGGTAEPPVSGPSANGPTDPGTDVIGLPEPAPPPDDVLPAAGQIVPTIAARRIQAALRPLVASKRLGGHTAVQVAGLDGRPVFSSGTPALVTPASTLKLLTSVAALQQWGPQHRFETRVVGGPGGIVLVGGGDPLLTNRNRPAAQAGYPVPATLEELARATARSLREDGRSRVRLSYDDTLFRGPAINPYWEPSYVPESIVSPVTALWVDEGRSVPGLAQRVPDPSLTAARRFAEQLAAAGIKVTGPLRSVRTGSSAPELAAVASPTLQQIVQHVLEVSDNEGAEVLLRQAAIGAGQPGSSAAGTRTVLATLRSLGVDTAGAVIHDGSGLARSNVVDVATLVQTLQAVADPTNGDLRAVVSTLPVAGFSGSLDDRFLVVAPAGLGQVRAKTGTLTGVHGLAGVVTTRLGHALTFAAVADDVPVPRTLDARAQLDRIAAALAACRC